MIIYCPRIGIYREITREKTRDESELMYIKYVPIHNVV